MSGWSAAWDAYLSWDQRRCLDLRAAERFARGHLAHATHVDGAASLRPRFSTLPPPGLPFLVVCDAEELDHVARVFQPPERWAIHAIIAVRSADTSAFLAPPSDASHPCFVVTDAELAQAARHSGVWRSAPAQARTHDDSPHLLFRPAPAVARVAEVVEQRRLASVNVLDIGCGAGRDITYLLARARASGSNCVWRATALDRWKAALERVRLLLSDHGMLATSTDSSGALCDAVLDAVVEQDGKVRRAPYGPLALDAFASTCLPHRQYDLVLFIRFWHLPLLRQLPTLVAPAGLVVLSHFVHEPHSVGVPCDAHVLSEYASPPVDARIHPGDVELLLEGWEKAVGRSEPSWRVLENRIEAVEDGRPVQSVLIERIASCSPRA